MVEQPTDGGKRQIRVGEKDIAVAALETDFLFDRYTGVGEGGARGRRIDIVEPVGKAQRMGAAADGFPVGVENDQLHIA